MPIEVRYARRFLEYAFPIGVIAGGFVNHSSFAHPLNVGPFAAKFRFTDVTSGKRLGRFEGGQEIGMAGKEFPQDRHYTFVAKDHFPGRLDPSARLLRQKRDRKSTRLNSSHV